MLSLYVYSEKFGIQFYISVCQTKIRRVHNAVLLWVKLRRLLRVNSFSAAPKEAGMRLPGEWRGVRMCGGLLLLIKSLMKNAPNAALHWF